MSRPTAAILTRRAAAELREAVAWIAHDDRRAALRLQEAVMTGTRLLMRHPQIGRLRPDLAPDGIRFMAVSGYPYLIVYEQIGDRLQILRILHTARDLGSVLSDFRPPSV